jgi:hypothetical protein
LNALYNAIGSDVTALCVCKPDSKEEEFRYLPNKEMRDLRTQMKAIEEAQEERRRK